MIKTLFSLWSMNSVEKIYEFSHIVDKWKIVRKWILIKKNLNINDYKIFKKKYKLHKT